MKTVSIITPSLNQAAFLPQTIRSVLDQDYPAVEYLIVDGGSTDGSLEIIEKHTDQLSWWVSETDKGQADAINKGLAHARGEICAWLNSDDYYLAGAVGSAVRRFEEFPDAVLVYGNMQAVDDAGRILNQLKYGQTSLADLLCFEIIGQPAVFVRRSAAIAVGGLDPSLHYLLDHQFWIHLATRGGLVHVDETWAAARYHAEAKNRAQARQFGQEAFKVLHWAAKEADVAPILEPIQRRARAAAHRVDARYLVDADEPWSALRAWFRAFLLHPPTAMSRLNLFASALLKIAGLDGFRERLLHRRQRRLEI